MRQDSKSVIELNVHIRALDTNKDLHGSEVLLDVAEALTRVFKDEDYVVVVSGPTKPS